MHEENKTKNRAAIALALCFCVLALTSFLAVKSSLNKISNSGMTAADNSTSAQHDQQAAAKTNLRIIVATATSESVMAHST